MYPSADTIEKIAIFVFGCLLGGVLGVWYFTSVGSEGIFSRGYWNIGDAATTTLSEVVRNVGLLIVAAAGLFVGTWRAFTAWQQTKTAQKQAEIAERGHFTDRFTAATEQLGSESLPVRLGGIHALWRLAKEAPEDNVRIVLDILCAYVRNPPFPGLPVENEQGKPDSPGTISPDVQTIMNLTTAPVHDDRNIILPTGYFLDFSGANLSFAKLDCAFMDGVILDSAILSFTHLEGANLTDSSLRSADFSGATLLAASLAGSDLYDADLSDTILAEANMKNVDNLKQEQLDKADFSQSMPPINLPDNLVCNDKAHTQE